MLSESAYQIAGILACAGEDVFTLRDSVNGQKLTTPDLCDSYLRDSLAELARLGAITWALETDYGRARPIRPDKYDEPTFREYWGKCFPEGGPRGQYPDERHHTLMIDPTDEMFVILGEEDKQREKQ